MTTIVTHNGHFHADELLAVAMLLLKYPDAKIIRTRDEEAFASADIAVDVGHVNDPLRGRFDHHQPGGAGIRENGIPYASSGLVWKALGEDLAGSKDEAKAFDESLLMSVDALDNGVSVYTLVFEGVAPYTLGDFFESFAKGMDTIEAAEKAFFEALPVAQELIRREIAAAKRIVYERREVRRIYDESADKHIILLPAAMHWKKVLIPTEAKFVIYPRTDGKWGMQAVPKTFHSFDTKKALPASWAGLSNGEMVKASGVADAFFCHRDRHLAGASSKEGALKLAEIALNS